jgi:hypothetical protein
VRFGFHGKKQSIAAGLALGFKVSGVQGFKRLDNPNAVPKIDA